MSSVCSQFRGCLDDDDDDDDDDTLTVYICIHDHILLHVDKLFVIPYNGYSSHYITLPRSRNHCFDIFK